MTSENLATLRAAVLEAREYIAGFAPAGTLDDGLDDYATLIETLTLVKGITYIDPRKVGWRRGADGSLEQVVVDSGRDD